MDGLAERSAAAAFWTHVLGNDDDRAPSLHLSARIQLQSDNSLDNLRVCAKLADTEWTVVRSFADLRTLAAKAARAHLVAPEGRVLPDENALRTETIPEVARAAGLWLDALLCSWQRENRWARVFRYDQRALCESRVAAVASALERFFLDDGRGFAAQLGLSSRAAIQKKLSSSSAASVFSDGPVDYDDSVFGSDGGENSSMVSVPPAAAAPPAAMISSAADSTTSSSSFASDGGSAGPGETPAQSFKDLGAVAWLSQVLRRSAAFQAQAAAVVADTVWPAAQSRLRDLSESHVGRHRRRRSSLGCGSAAAAAAHARLLDSESVAETDEDLRCAVEAALAPASMSARMHSRRGSECSTFSAGSGLFHFRFSKPAQDSAEEPESEQVLELLQPFDERDEDFDDDDDDDADSLCDEDPELADLGWLPHDPDDPLLEVQRRADSTLARKAPVVRLLGYEEAPADRRGPAFALFCATVELEDSRCPLAPRSETCWSPVSVPDTAEAKQGFMESAHAYTGSVLDGARSCIQTHEQ